MNQQTNPTSNLICIDKRHETDDVIVITFADSLKREFTFSPGQYITLTTAIEGQSFDRCYTISSCPQQSDRIEIIVKRAAQGKMSNWLFDHLAIGDSIQASAPCGQFSLAQANNTKVLLLSAGVGITPLLSILRHIAKHNLAYDVIFHHSAKSESDIIAAHELDTLSHKYPNLKLSYNLTRELAQPNSNYYSGRIKDEMLTHICPDITQRDVFICGPSEYMELAKQLLTKQGLASSQFFQEDFELAPLQLANADDKTYNIDFCHSKCRAEISSGETVLDVALRLGIDVETSCSSGVCGSCTSYVIEGDITAPQAQAIDDEDISSGEFLPCCSYPLSHLKVDL